MHVIPSPISRPLISRPWRLVSASCAVAAFALSLGTAHAAPYGPDATTPAEAAAAGALDAIGSPEGTSLAGLHASIGALPETAARAEALGQLSPRNYRLLPRLAIQSMDASDAEIRSYLAQRRDSALADPQVARRTGDQSVHFMLSYALKQAKFDAHTDRPSANSDSRSIRAGVDFVPAPGVIVGVTLGIDGIDASLDRSQPPRITQFNAHIGPYASYTNGRFFVEATGLYARSEHKLRRQVGWTGFDDFLRAGPAGDNAAATVAAGAMLASGAFRAQPYLGMQYRYADVSGFLERGGSAALGVAQFNTKSLRGNAGVRASAALKQGNWTIRPDLHAEWQRELRSNPDSRIEAIFASGETSIFTLPAGRTFARDAAIVGAGIAAEAGGRIMIRAGYRGEYASDRHVHAFSLTASRRF